MGLLTVTNVPLRRIWIMGEVVYAGAGSIGEISVPSAPFRCELKTALKIQILFEK